MSALITDGIAPSLDLNGDYDPLKDAASDGFVDLSNQARKDGASALNDANAAPEASPADKQSFWRAGIYIGVFLFGILATFLAAIVWYKNANKDAPIERTAPAVQTPPPAAAIAPTKQPPKKAIKPAVEPTNEAPTKTEVVPTKSVLSVQPVTNDPLAPALQEFYKLVSNFERKMP